MDGVEPGGGGGGGDIAAGAAIATTDYCTFALGTCVIISAIVVRIVNLNCIFFSSSFHTP